MWQHLFGILHLPFEYVSDFLLACAERGDDIATCWLANGGPPATPTVCRTVPTRRQARPGSPCLILGADAYVVRSFETGGVLI